MQKERDEVVAKREETERMTETLREESKDLQLRKQTLEEDIENLSESLHVKAEGIVKGTAQGVADWFTGKSKRRAKKAEENEAKTKAEASAQIKAIRDKCAAKRKTGGGQDNRGRQDNHPIYVLEKITSGESGPN